MADMLQQGSQWLEQMRTAHCSSTVEYRRATVAKSVHATCGRTAVELADESGLTVRAHIWDFLVLAEELGFDPEPGDVIAAGGRRYEVMNLGEGCWRWSDAYRQTYRIHTKDIGDDAPVAP